VRRKLITLLTDFGEQDVYVAVMKGVITQINPELWVIDLTHQIPPQNLAAARFNLMSACPYFPVGTVHVAVVDPGVGSLRRAIAVECALGFLVGPDNGLFSGILSQYPVIQAVELTHSQYWRTAEPSTTFHGRDIFAPIAAHLASDVPLGELGRGIDPHTLVQLPLPEYQKTEDGAIGRIQYIDRFGNLITNIPGALVVGKSWAVIVGGRAIVGDLTYSRCPPGTPLALVGSQGWVEIAVNQGNACEYLQFSWGDSVRLRY
jgi:hypothetical protein